MNPLVSVIIPVYNAEKYIDECIASILNQTYPNIEVIICEDCSTDSTWQHLKKYGEDPRIEILQNSRNIYQAASRNRCIKKCSGEFIMVQDADDIAEPERIRKLLAVFEDGIDFVGSGCYLFDENGIFDKLYGRRQYPVVNDLLRGMPFVHASMMFRKECLELVGGYRVSRETIRGEDYDLIMRLYAKGFRGKNIEDLLYGYRVNSATYARRTFRARLKECIVRYKGYEANHILFPFGWLYTGRPILAHFYHQIKNLKGKKYEKDQDCPVI